MNVRLGSALLASLTLGLAATCGPAAAASTKYYLVMPAATHLSPQNPAPRILAASDRIAVLRFSVESHNGSALGSGGSSGPPVPGRGPSDTHEAGSANTQLIHLTLDAAAERAMIEERLRAGSSLPTLELDAVRNVAGKSEPYLTIHMKRAFISKTQVSSEGERTIENVDVTYEAIEYTYAKQSEGGTGWKVEQGWDIKAATPS